MKDLESARRLYVEVEATQMNLFHSHSVCLLRTHDALLKVVHVAICTHNKLLNSGTYLSPLRASSSSKTSVNKWADMHGDEGLDSSVGVLPEDHSSL